MIQGIVLWISGSNTVSGVRDGLVNWTITNRFLGISMVFWYGVAADDLPLVRVRVHRPRAGGCCSSVAGATCRG